MPVPPGGDSRAAHPRQLFWYAQSPPSLWISCPRPANPRSGPARIAPSLSTVSKLEIAGGALSPFFSSFARTISHAEIALLPRCTPED